MTKLLGVLAIALAIWGGYEIFEMWDRYDTDKDLKAQQAAASVVIGDQLQGMPDGLERTYQIAQKNGAEGIRKWLKAYGARVQDPRRAWIELDYMVLIAHEDPVEAKKVFADVKARVPESSRVYPRVKELEKTYD
jgi:hypothetical protein